jgi:hypothetical protein
LKPGEKLSACSPASMRKKELGTTSAIYGPIFNESLLKFDVFYFRNLTSRAPK